MVNSSLLHSIVLFFQLFSISVQVKPRSSDSLKQYEIFGTAQGTTYSIKYIATSSKITKYQIDSILLEIDSSLSLYNKNSLISQFNLHSKTIKADQHLFNVVQQSKQISKETNQAFDFTLKKISSLWGFQTNNSSPQPKSASIRKALRFTGADQIDLIDSFLVKKDHRVQIDCDGIAQGYSVDYLASFFKSKNIQNFTIELGGEIVSKGYNLKNECWKILVNPNIPQNFSSQPISVALCNHAITTSGKYSKFIQVSNLQRSHIINPQTGAPLENNVLAVTVIAEKAALADALDNAFMVMGVDSTFAWLKRHNPPNIGVYFTYQTPEGNLADTCNTYFKKFLK